MSQAENRLEERLDELYRAQPEAFIKARDRLAAELKEAGETEAAATVRRLKRPTRAAWVVNRLSLESPAEMQRLLESAERLRELYTDLARSGSGDELRDAVKDERDAVASLMEVAREKLADARVSAAVLDRVAETLQAVAADEETARVVGAGRLERERRAATLTGDAEAPPAPAKPEPRSADRERRRKEANATLKRLRRDAKGAQAREKRERTTVERAQAQVEKAEKTLEAAQAALDDAQAEVADLDGEIERTERLIDELR